MNKRFSQVAPVLRWLLQHGKPATVTEIAQSLGKPRPQVENTIWGNPAIFVKAGETRPAGIGGKPVILWSAWEE